MQYATCNGLTKTVYLVQTSYIQLHLLKSRDRLVFYAKIQIVLGTSFSLNIGQQLMNRSTKHFFPRELLTI